MAILTVGLLGKSQSNVRIETLRLSIRLPNNIDFICPNIDIEYCPKSPKYCQYIDNIDLETAPNIDNILNIDSGISAQILNILKY